MHFRHGKAAKGIVDTLSEADRNLEDADSNYEAAFSPELCRRRASGFETLPDWSILPQIRVTCSE